MKKYIPIALIFVSCLVIPSVQVAAQTTPPDYKSHTPEEFIEMMKKSEIAYTLKTEENIKPTHLVVSGTEPYSINPYSRIEYAKDGKMTLIIDEPKGEIKKIHELAAEKLKQKDYDELVKLYNHAIELDNSYFKTWTNLGDTYYYLGKYDEAEKCLLKAIELNNIGYQEHYFLADVYNKMGNNQKALEHITYAYMLNKNNPGISKSLHRILGKNNLKLKTNRWELPFQIKKIGDKECEIAFQEKDDLNWIPMANCLACWKMEPSFQKLLSDEQYAINNKINMYKECILNQVAVIATKKEKHEDISAQEQQLYNVVNDGYLNAILYWEIAAGEHPQILLLLPKNEKNSIVEYIKKYVYEKK